MSKQTTFGGAEPDDGGGDEERSKGACQRSASTERESQSEGKRNVSSEGRAPPSAVARHGSEALEPWVAERREQEENFGYGHLFAKSRSDLSGIQYELGWEARIERPDPEREATSTSRVTFEGANEENALSGVVSWKLGVMTTPYHPQLRDVSVANVQVFVAETAREHLRDEGYPIERVLETLRDLPEHHPSEADLQARREELRLKRKGGVQGSLKLRKNAIEQTIRARFGFTSRYGHSVPNPDARFVDLDLTALEHQLDVTRKWLDRASVRLTELRDERQASQLEWLSQTKQRRFPELGNRKTSEEVLRP